MTVIDSSALVEFVLNPKLSQRSAHLLGDDVYAPALLVPESLNALKKQVTRKLISSQRATIAMQRIHSAPIEMVSMHALTDEIWKLSGTFSTYDACYVALAKHLGSPLMTCDVRLVTEAEKHVRVVTPH